MTHFSGVDIINIGDDLEVMALRAMLERWGAVVRVWHVASAAHLVALLNGTTSLSNIVVMSCHGSFEGLHLPELAAEVAAQQPYNNILTATQMREFLQLPDKLVINTGCSLGRSDFADAFLDAGCKYYIGAHDYIDGAASLLYLSLFFYLHLCRQELVEVAHQRAATYDAETGFFHLSMRNVSTR